MCFIDIDAKLDALAWERSDQAFGVCIQPWKPDCYDSDN